MAAEHRPEEDRIRKLERAVEELSILNDLARAISLSEDLDAIQQTIVQRSMKAVKAEQANISLLGGDGLTHRTLVYNVKNGGEDHFHLNRRLTGMMAVEKRAHVSNDVRSDPLLKDIELDPGMRNMVCVPLRRVPGSSGP